MQISTNLMSQSHKVLKISPSPQKNIYVKNEKILRIGINVRCNLKSRTEMNEKRKP